jgi:formylglycine-generating enzyme required for sulfatase activity
LRDWLTRKQKETRRGRAELLLADRAAVWNARPENRQLPSLLQWCSIRWLTQKQKWTSPQRKMIGKAGRYHALRAGSAAVLLAVATFTGLMIRDRVEEKQKANHAAGLVQAVLNADIAQVPAIVGQMTEYRHWADPLLRESNSKAADKSRQKLHTSLALLPVDASQVNYLKDRLLDAEPGEVAVLRDALFPHKDGLLDKLWAAVEAPARGKEHQRLRAAAALAKYVPESEKWAKVQGEVANDLVAVPAVYLGMWMDGFRPVRTKLFAPLSAVFRDSKRRDAERSLATDILGDYAADQPQRLADLLMDADDKQFAVLYPKFKEQGEQGLSVLTAEIDKKLPPGAKDEAKEKLAKRQANAAVALLRLGQSAKVWPLLKRTPPDDPRVRSYLIHRLSPLGADAGAIVKRLDEEPDITIRRALLLSLGEFGEKELPPDSHKALLAKLQAIYSTASDPGLHAAAEWLLRQWKEDDWLQQVNEAWAGDKEQRAKRLQGIRQRLSKDKAKTPPQWYVNGQGQTMVVIPGPVEFVMGSPPTEEGRQVGESQHKRRIGRTFALAAKPVTKEQFLRFLPKFSHTEMRRYPEPTCPMGGVVWYEAAAYCNWLSQQEGIPAEQWCYETNARGQVVKLKENYLSLTGYRLPTEAEMEYACRAGAVTSRYYGETEELLAEYGWYWQNSQERTWPVGGKKPNDLGLFDLHGNVYTWCQESYQGDYPVPKDDEAVEDKEDDLSINPQTGRVLRGGSFFNLASNVRSADRLRNVPTNRGVNVGFRPARTFTP